MNYFKQLLESYSQLKKRKLKLLEQSGGEIQGNSPDQKVRYIISKTKTGNYTKKTPLILTLGNKNFVCWKSAKGEIIALFDRSYNLTNNPQSIYHLLKTSEDEGADLEGAPEQQQGDQVMADPAAPMAPMKPPDVFPDLLEGDLLDPLVLQDSLAGVPDQTRVAILSQAGKLLNSGYVRVQGIKEITILSAIKRTRTVINCTDPSDPGCKPQIVADQAVITEAQKVAARNLKTALDILTKKDNLTLEDEAFLSQTISISGRNQVIIKDQVSGKGVMITERNPILSVLLNALSSLKEVDVGEEQKRKLSLTSSRRNFVKEDTTGIKVASALRGNTFEKLRVGMIELRKCLEINPNKALCSEMVTKSYLSFTEQQMDSMQKSFESLVEQYRRDGTISSDLDNADDIYYVNGIIRAFGKGSFDNAESAFQKFSYVMMQLATAGVNQRKPDSVEKVAAITGLGRKADTREYYPTKEAAEQALITMNLQNSTVRIEQTSRGFAINDSLKFTTQSKKVDLGQASYSNMIVTLNCAVDNIGCDDIVNAQVKLLTDSGLTPADFVYLKEELNKVREDADAFKAIATKTKTKTEDGKTIVRGSRKKLLETALKHLQDTDTYGGATSNLRFKIKKLISESEDTLNEEETWSELSDEIACTLQIHRVQKLWDSTEKESKRKALGFMVGLGVFSGGAADGSMLSVADALNGRIYTTDQTATLKPMVDSLVEDSNPTVDIKHNKFVINGIPIYWNGNRTDCFVPLELVEKTIKERNIGSIKDIRRSSAINAGTIYSGGKLDESIVQYLINQQVLLNKILKSISTNP